MARARRPDEMNPAPVEVPDCSTLSFGTGLLDDGRSRDTRVDHGETERVTAFVVVATMLMYDILRRAATQPRPELFQCPSFAYDKLGRLKPTSKHLSMSFDHCISTIPANETIM